MPGSTSTSERIFDVDGSVVVKNIKLFPGTSNDTSPDEIVGQVSRVLTEIENDALEVVELGEDD